jgi:hypothetical protein
MVITKCLQRECLRIKRDKKLMKDAMIFPYFSSLMGKSKSQCCFSRKAV